MELNIIRCALVSGDEEFRSTAEQVLTDPGGLADFVAEVPVSASEFGESAIEELFASDPEVVFLDLGEDPADGISILRSICESSPDLIIIPAGPPVGAEALLEVMRSGASEYLPKPVSPDDVEAALTRAARKLGGVHTKDDREEARTLAILSAKGGVGVTTLAANLAIELRRASRSRTLLLDLNLELGTAAAILGIQPRYSFLDLIRNFHRLDDDLLDSYLERHESGIHLLASPDRPEEIEGVTEKHIRVLLHFLRGHFGFIVIDLGRHLNPIATAALEQSDQCLMVATPTLPTLRNIKRVLPLVRVGAGSDPSAIKLLLNEYTEDGEISVAQVEEVLGLDVFLTLPKDDLALRHSVNIGRPVVLNGKSRYSKDVRSLSSLLAGTRPEGGSGGALSKAFAAMARPFKKGGSPSTTRKRGES